MTVRLFHASRLPRPARKPALLKRAVLAALGPAARREGELNLVFLRRAAMRRLNRSYLGHDDDTDVIAFPYPKGGKGSPFGDVFVSLDRARRQARDLGHPLLDEVLTLAIHGSLHLAGYRDHGPAERRRMFARQDRVLRAVGHG
ncbi:MAG: rRNA maturation RNase YbeY [Elusimicrobia bacterium]|nr:rRNA maturation RNase YbeY [Elusimicrobiota bacterium]